jgi:transposase
VIDSPQESMQSLPEDAAALRVLVLATMAERDVTLAERDAAVTERDTLLVQNDRLRHLLLQLRRMHFGARSERLPEEQLQLGLEALEQAIAKDEAQAEKQDPELRKDNAAKRRASRGALPAHLPRIELTLTPEDTACPCCRATMTVIGEDTSERLDVIPAQFRVIVTKRPKLACRACAGTVVQAPAPPRLIEGGIPTEAMVAHVLVARYADHLPLYRQAQMMARQGVIIERSTLSFWMGYAAAEIAPVVARLREMLLASTRIFADETVVPVLDPGRGRTKQGYFWATLAKVPPAQRVECQRRALRVTIARGAAALRRRWFTATRLAGGISTPTRYWAATAVSCNATATAPTKSSVAPSPPRLTSRWRSAGAMCAADSTIWPRRRRRSRRRHCSALPPSTRSRRVSAARAPLTGWRCVRPKVNRWSRKCVSGSKSR